MKAQLLKALLICLISFFPTQSFSQNYLSIFGQNSTMWSGISNGFCDGICSTIIMANGDTNINGLTYTKLYPGFIREDTVVGKIWFYDTTQTSEYLVMDLGLSIGDTFPIYNYNGTVYNALVDSVYFVSGLKRVRLNYEINVCMPPEKIIFIEGSGPTSWFNYQESCCGVISYMLCHYKDGVKVTGNTMFQDSCQVCETGIPENKSKSFLKAFPNPAGNQLTLSLEKPIQQGDFVIRNVLGEKVLSFTLDDKTKVLNIEKLEKGVYFISNTSGEYRGAIKFVKE